jgi:hypothetical protein
VVAPLEEQAVVAAVVHVDAAPSVAGLVSSGQDKRRPAPPGGQAPVSVTLE